MPALGQPLVEDTQASALCPAQKALYIHPYALGIQEGQCQAPLLWGMGPDRNARAPRRPPRKGSRVRGPLGFSRAWHVPEACLGRQRHTHSFKHISTCPRGYPGVRTVCRLRQQLFPSSDPGAALQLPQGMRAKEPEPAPSAFQPPWSLGWGPQAHPALPTRLPGDAVPTTGTTSSRLCL